MKSWAWDRRSKFWNKFYITFNIPHFLKDWWMKAWWQLLHFRDNNATIKSYCSFSPEMIWIRMFFKGCLPQISHAVYCEELAKYLPYCTRHSAITSIYKKWQNKQTNKQKEQKTLVKYIRFPTNWKFRGPILNEATKSYFTHFSCLVIVLFDTALGRFAFSTVSFKN